MKEKLVQLIKKSKKNEKGFTLIEMIVVIAIIGVLAAILVPSMNGYINNSKKVKLDANVRTLYTAAQAAVASVNPTLTGDATYNSSSVPTTSPMKEIHEQIVNLVGTSNMNKFTAYTIKVKTNGSVIVTAKDASGEATYPEGETALTLPTSTSTSPTATP